MGLDRRITLRTLPDWPIWTGRLAAQGLPVTLRMQDGELTFPDETPREDWRELRVGVPAGMLTLHREADGVRIVLWGNATEELKLACDHLEKALTEQAP